MSKSFIDDFGGEDLGYKILCEELKPSLEKAVNLSPKSTVTAYFPKVDYKTADMRMQITANLDVIRINPNNKKSITITADAILADGTYSSEVEPDYAKIEMSYLEFAKISVLDFSQKVVQVLGRKLINWDAEHNLVKEYDPFGAFDDVDDNSLKNRKIKVDNKTSSQDKKSESKKQQKKLNCDIFIKDVSGLKEKEQLSKPTVLQLKTFYSKFLQNNDFGMHICLNGKEDMDKSVEIYRVSDQKVRMFFKNKNQDISGFFHIDSVLDLVYEYINSGNIEMIKYENLRLKDAERWIRMFGIFGVTPYTWIAGFLVLFFKEKAKMENSGELSEKSKKFFNMGIIGFFVYLSIFLLIIFCAT